MAFEDTRKFCVNCAHARIQLWQDVNTRRIAAGLPSIPVPDQYICEAPARSRDLVTGVYAASSCYTQRKTAARDFCGPSGLFYEQKKGGLDTQNQV